MRGKCRRYRGAAIVELCIALPLFVLVLFAIFDFGNVLYLSISVNQAAREASRDFATTVNSISTAAAISNATAAVKNYNSNFQVTFTYASGAAVQTTDKISSGVPVTTLVTDRVSVMTPGVCNFMPNPMMLHGHAVMNVEGP